MVLTRTRPFPRAATGQKCVIAIRHWNATWTETVRHEDWNKRSDTGYCYADKNRTWSKAERRDGVCNNAASDGWLQPMISHTSMAPAHHCRVGLVGPVACPPRPGAAIEVTKWKSCCSWRGCTQSQSQCCDRRDVTGQHGWLAADERPLTCIIPYSDQLTSWTTQRSL